jgi:Putative zinc-finger
MMPEESHLTDQDLLLAADGELSAARAAQVAAHLSECWPCRARKQEMEQAIVDFIHLHRGHLDPLLPPSAGPRALLKARVAEMASGSRPRGNPGSEIFTWKQAVAALLFAAIVAVGYHFWPPAPSFQRVALPEPSLTPGAVATVNREQVCRSAWLENPGVPLPLQHKVFAEYGIPRPEPQAYEVDYLITPALGGADDIRNLWPQPYSATAWNAHVKDALEDRLRELVCSGQLDLATAQRDISSDWIAAYRKYFHTDKPLETAR